MSMKRYVMLGLYAAFCLSWAGVITCVVLQEDVGGALALDAECRHRFALYLSPASQLAVASDAWLVSLASRGAKGAVPAGCGDAVLLGIPRF